MASTSSGRSTVAKVVPATVQLEASAREASPKPRAWTARVPHEHRRLASGPEVEGQERDAREAERKRQDEDGVVLVLGRGVDREVAARDRRESVAARPSMLSSRLNAFVIPTSQTSPIAQASTSLPTISTSSPLASAKTAAPICAASFAIGLRWRRSSTSPATNSSAMPPKIPPSSALHSMAPVASASSTATTKPAKIPTPPNIGVARSCHLWLLGSATRRVPRVERGEPRERRT